MFIWIYVIFMMLYLQTIIFLRTYLHVPVVYTKYMYNVEKSTYSPEKNLYKMFRPLDNQFFNNVYT